MPAATSFQRRNLGSRSSRTTSVPIRIFLLSRRASRWHRDRAGVPMSIKTSGNGWIYTSIFFFMLIRSRMGRKRCQLKKKKNSNIEMYNFIRWKKQTRWPSDFLVYFYLIFYRNFFQFSQPYSMGLCATSKDRRQHPRSDRPRKLRLIPSNSIQGDFHVIAPSPPNAKHFKCIMAIVTPASFVSRSMHALILLSMKRRSKARRQNDTIGKKCSGAHIDGGFLAAI